MANGNTDETNSITEDLQEDNANETVVSAEVKTKPKKAHACKHCDKSYTQSHNPKQHMRKVHPVI